MTRTQFMVICGEYNIDPPLALENDAIVEALRNNASEQEIRHLFETEF